MKSETKKCQNCKNDFIIEPEDFNFYEKIKVPPPTFCPHCRFVRRMAYRNERTLFKRFCDLCKRNIISIYPSSVVFPVYCKECWYLDKWEATEYGRDYDFSRPFFEQLKELFFSVPHLAIWQRNVINSEFSNMIGECKNVYLSSSVVLGSENVFYSKIVDKSSNIFDSYGIKDSDKLYENLECEKNYNSQHLILSNNCLDSYFLIDCRNCSNCILSNNLRNKQYFIRNKKYSKEDYFKELGNLNLGSRKSREILIKEFEKIKKNAIYRFANINKSISSTGNNLLNVKNCINCFDVYNTENSKNCYRVISNKDSMDVDFGGVAELLYEYSTGALNDYNVRFSYSAMESVQNAEYTESCISSSNIFGCNSLKKKEYVIFNKIYSKEGFYELREKIIEHMNSMPFIGNNGRVYRYGEFFPVEFSHFSYNESCAQDFFPLTKNEILEKGYIWHEPEEKNNIYTISAELIPDDIKEVENKILNEALQCLHNRECNHQCTKAFRLTQDEFSFYKEHNIPIPNKCYNCRYYGRFQKILPLKLWYRKCMKEGCNNEFETSYDPERPEIVYCERCYQQEVY
ncbi:MAG: hypothetical protein WC264_02990 [Candidatus Paceibacterota bacterium]|jgi:hypothetical protein